MERSFVAIALAVIVSAFVSSGCLNASYATAKTAAIINDTVQALATIEKTQEQICIEKNATAADARSCLAKVQTDWDPIWKDYDTLRAASNDDFPVAFCLFRDRMNAAGIKVPDLYGLCS